MTPSAAIVSRSGERRIRVVDDRVACWRIGPVDLERCRECVYLQHLEFATDPDAMHVVCTGADLDAEVDFAW